MTQESIRILAAVVLKFAYLGTGLVICLVGKTLLEKGITGKLTGEGEIASNRLRLVTSSPGLVFLIAGLSIVIAAILTQAQIPVSLEPEPTQRAPAPKKAPSGNAKDPAPEGAAKPPLESLPRIATFSLLTPDEQMAEQEVAATAVKMLSAARKFMQEGKSALAQEYLMRSIALDPSLLEKLLRDPQLNRSLRHPVMDAMIRSRLELGLRAQYAVTLDSQTRMLLSFLQIKGLSIPKGDSSATAMESGQERISRVRDDRPIEEIRAVLRELIAADPMALQEILQDREYRWLLDKREYKDWLVEELRPKVAGEK